jgi:hypothetical protein
VLGELASIQPAGVIGRFDPGQGFSLHCSLQLTTDDGRPVDAEAHFDDCAANSSIQSTPFGKTMEYFERSDQAPTSHGAMVPEDRCRDIEEDLRVFRRAQGSALYSPTRAQSVSWRVRRTRAF